MTASAPSVRAASAADLSATHEIYAHHVAHGLGSFEETAPDLTDWSARYRGLVADGYPFLVAEHEGRVGGYAYASAYRSRPAYRFAVQDSVYVAPDCQGHGLGQALLAELIARCTAQGFRRMVAVIGDSGNHASVGLHERQGFALVGVLPAVGFKHGRWVDTVLMERALGEGDRTLPGPERP
ncbi:MAG: N-acetyltransferase family protein [Pseudomonadota bacterium]